MFKALGKTYFQVGDKVNTTKFDGAPAVVVKCAQVGAMGEYYYTLNVDVSNHPDGFDENGERVNFMTSYSHESEVSAI